MLYKRFIALVAGCLLFIASFIIYSDLSHKHMEDDFRAEREKFNVDQLVLTASDTPTSTTPAAAAASSSDTNALIGPVPPPVTDGAATSATDTNAAPATTDTNSTPAPAAPSTDMTTPATMTPSAPATDSGTPAATPSTDTNAAPATPPPDTNSAPAAPASTQYRGQGRSPFFQLASYRPSDDAARAFTDSTVGVVGNGPPPSASSLQAPASVDVTPSPAPSSAPTHTGDAGEGSVIVLLYHQFKPAGYKIPAMYQWTMNEDVFESEMKYIHDNGYNVISMDDLIKFIKHQGTVPPRAVCITIDDGYKSAIVYAAPILKKYGYPWTFFIYPDFVTVAEGSGAVSWNDLLALQAQGIDIESHSMTHPNLKLHHQKIKGVWHNFTDAEYADWLTNETAGAKALLEKHMGKPITRFAYPYGEYNKQVEDAVIAAGYEAIFTVADNPVHATTSLHSIGRYTITQGVEKNFAAYLRQGALGLSAADPAPGATISNPRPVITATLGYPGTLDPKSIETSVRDFGDVRHDFDPQTNTVRLYLPRDLIQPVVLVNIRVKDATSGQVMVANWHFNYEPDPAAAAAAHVPIAPAVPVAPKATEVAPAAVTNAPAATTPPEPLEKTAPGTPLDAHPAAKPATSPD